MITDAILNVLGWIGAGMFSLFPDLPNGAESVNANVAGGVAQFMSSAAELGVWIPWGAIIPAFLIIVSVYGFTVVVTIVRRVISHVTGGGGAIG